MLRHDMLFSSWKLLPSFGQFGSAVYICVVFHSSVLSDHKPLESLFYKYSLAAIDNPRVLNYRSRLCDFSFEVKWRKGKEQQIPDALSRAPTTDPEERDVDDDDNNIRVGAIIENSSVEDDLILDDLRRRAKNDPDYQELIRYIQADFNGVPSVYVQQFRKLFSELSIEDDLVLRGHRIVIPPNAIKFVLHRLHASHQGLEKTKRRARQTVYWPGFGNDIATTVEACESCQMYRPSLVPEPMIQDPLPTRAFDVVTSDLFTFGSHHYLVYVDRFSGFPMVAKFMDTPNSSEVMKTFRKLFSLMGVPRILRSDNGPQYRSEEMQNFLREWGVIWKPSSPYHPQSNGHAEVSVKIVKRLLQKTGGDMNTDAFLSGLLEIRNSPRDDGLSPAQRVFGKPLRSLVPVNWRSFEPGWNKSAEEADKKRLQNMEKRKQYYDRSTRPLSSISSGSRVLVQDPTSLRWDTTANVVGTEDNRRYRLRFPSGRVLWRNRKFLRLLEFRSGIDDDEDSLPTANDLIKTPIIPSVRRSSRQSIPPNRLRY